MATTGPHSQHTIVLHTKLRDMGNRVTIAIPDPVASQTGLSSAEAQSPALGLAQTVVHTSHDSPCAVKTSKSASLYYKQKSCYLG